MAVSVVKSPDLQLKVKDEVFLSVSQAESENLNGTSKSSLSTGCITPNRNIDPSQQKKPKICVLQNEIVRNAKTQNILQPSQANPTNIVLHDEMLNILQPHPQARYQYYINPKGELCFQNDANKEKSVNE